MASQELPPSCFQKESSTCMRMYQNATHLNNHGWLSGTAEAVSMKSNKPSKSKAAKKAKKAGKSSRHGGEDKSSLSKEELQKRNPKAFVFSTRGKAAKQRMRSADKEQRRMHGLPSTSPSPLNTATLMSQPGTMTRTGNRLLHTV